MDSFELGERLFCLAKITKVPFGSLPSEIGLVQYTEFSREEGEPGGSSISSDILTYDLQFEQYDNEIVCNLSGVD